MRTLIIIAATVSAVLCYQNPSTVQAKVKTARANPDVARYEGKARVALSSALDAASDALKDGGK